MRGHVDSVNNVEFMPFSNLVISCSGDKTISMWDMRTSHCVQTYLGHKSAINDVKTCAKGDRMVSCDSDGVVYTWDCNMVKEFSHAQISNKQDLNGLRMEENGNSFVVGGNDKLVKIFDFELNLLRTMEGHEDTVLDVL